VAGGAPRHVAPRRAEGQRVNVHPRQQGSVRQRLRKDGTVTYDITYRVGSRSVKRKGGDTEEEARRALREALRAARSGLLLPRRAAPSTRFDDYANNWLTRIRPTIRSGTHAGYEDAVTTHLIPVLKDRQVRDIDLHEVEALRETLLASRPRRGSRRTTLAHATVNNILGVLSVLLSDALDHGLIAVHPMRGLPNGRPPRVYVTEPQQEMEYLRLGEIPHYLAGWDDEFDLLRDLGEVLVATGMRKGEAIALELDDVTVTSIRVVRQKTRDRHLGPTELKNAPRRRIVEIGERLYESVLRPRMERQRAAGSRLLFAQPDGTHFTHDQVDGMHGRALRRAGITRQVRPHDLRHTAAHAWLRAGKALIYVQRQLGDSRIGPYGHWELRDGRDATETENLIWGLHEARVPTAKIA
jgi:integrase